LNWASFSASLLRSWPAFSRTLECRAATSGGRVDGAGVGGGRVEVLGGAEVAGGGADARPANGGKLSTTRRVGAVDDSGAVPGLSGGKFPGARGRTGGITMVPICRDACSLCACCIRKYACSSLGKVEISTSLPDLSSSLLPLPLPGT